MFKVVAITCALVCASVSTPLMAQTPDPEKVIQSEKPAPNKGVSGLALDFLHDQKAIWTSPLHIQKSDLEWMAPAGVGIGALFVFDHRISNAVKGDASLRTPSNAISNVGLIAPYAVPGAMWFLGAAKHDSHAAEAGRLGLEAQLNSEVVMNVLKIATHRGRPNGEDYRSFPSGHTMSAFAVASVMAKEYHDKPLVVFGSYGFATAVGLARVGGLNHFPSDVLAGAVIGELIGRYVVHHHQTQAAN